MQTKLTKQLIEKTPLVPQGQVAIRDTEVRGLLIKIGAESKTFFVQHRVKGGKRVMPKIGGFPAWSVDAARAKARELIVKMDNGIDIQSDAKEARRPKPSGDAFDGSTFTVFQALDHYLNELRAEEKSQETIGQIEDETTRWLKDWKNRPLLTITKNDCKEVHRRIRTSIRAKMEKENPSALKDSTGFCSANRTLRYFQAAFNRVSYDFSDNGFPENRACPVRKGFKWFNEAARTERLGWKDLPGWWTATGKLPAIHRDAWRVLLLTGLRNGDCCSMRWEDMDFQNGLLTRPEPKGGKKRAFTVPLSAEAIDILKRRKADNPSDFGASDEGYCFPTRTRAGRTVTHIGLLKEQDLTADGKKTRNVVIGLAHDLRRTFRSAATECGVRKNISELLINHAVSLRPDIDERYDVRDVRDATFLRVQTQRITDFLLTHAGVKKAAQSHPNAQLQAQALVAALGPDVVAAMLAKLNGAGGAVAAA